MLSLLFINYISVLILKAFISRENEHAACGCELFVIAAFPGWQTWNFPEPLVTCIF